MDNQQIHQYHAQILEQQDEQLDRLGESIGRQRELSMQIGDELDSHVAMLDEVEAVTDRHQSRLDRASRMLGKVARGAGENKQMTTIVVLIIILVLLIAILK
jgi:syntaxin 8